MIGSEVKLDTFLLIAKTEQIYRANCRRYSDEAWIINDFNKFPKFEDQPLQLTSLMIRAY